MLVHELKETEIKLEEICEKIQIALTLVGDTDRLEQLEVWLDKLSEEALTTKTEAARYLDDCINDSNSSVSSKASFQGRRDEKCGARCKAEGTHKKTGSYMEILCLDLTECSSQDPMKQICI